MSKLEQQFNISILQLIGTIFNYDHVHTNTNVIWYMDTGYYKCMFVIKTSTYMITRSIEFHIGQVIYI